MATAYLEGPDGAAYGPKFMPAPKRACVRSWWNEARKVIRHLPLFDGLAKLDITDDVIIYEGSFGTLWIHRKKGHLGT